VAEWANRNSGGPLVRVLQPRVLGRATTARSTWVQNHVMACGLSCAGVCKYVAIVTLPHPRTTPPASYLPHSRTNRTAPTTPPVFPAAALSHNRAAPHHPAPVFPAAALNRIMCARAHMCDGKTVCWYQQSFIYLLMHAENPALRGGAKTYP